MKPPVLRFAEWTGKGRWWRTPRRSGQAAAVITHHSVTPVTDNPIGDAQTVENVIYARRFSAGFSSIPYGWLIHPDGTILEGRGINYRNAANRSTRSGVTLSNRNTVSVCLIGDYRHRDVTEAQRRAFQSLVTYLADLNVIGNASSISPHSALSRTVCDAGAYKQLSASPDPNTEALDGLNQSVPEPEAIPYPGHYIQQASTDTESVKLVQEVVSTSVDGIFGPLTEGAVKTWQKDHSLAVDGIVGPATWAAMFTLPPAKLAKSKT